MTEERDAPHKAELAMTFYDQDPASFAAALQKRGLVIEPYQRTILARMVSGARLVLRFPR
jgi:hypothetical protein